ncbi:MAG: ATP-binding protein, partial [Candidatus Omnitrophica bacterium]|nr:ATP-binding protein [Candidatus Omnitrophota bacterium]
MNDIKNLKEAGKTSATERDPNTSDKFTFWLAPKVIVNPFDIVEVEQVSHEGKSKTFGLVTTLEHRTDSPTHLANFISSNFGELIEDPNTPRQGTTVAHVNVLSNDKDIYMPVPSERVVKFSDERGIQIALGIDTMEPKDRIPAGLIKMSNGVAAVAYIDRRYVLGPESAHVNISGISGLATKTSYAMFLIQSILQTTPEAEKEKLTVIILNVKHGDLLQLDQRREREFSVEEMEMWEALGLKPEPFPADKIHYYLPRGRDGDRPNSFLVPNSYNIYAYDLESTADKLDLLFAQIPDAYFTLESIISEIKEGIRNRETDFRNVHSWTNLLSGPPLFDPQTRA